MSAGISGLGFRTFALSAYPGGLAWILSFISIGYFAGAQWEHLEPLLNRGILVAAGIIAGIVLIVWKLRRRVR